MVLMIDNYDSFTYNLVQYFGELGEDVRVVRNDDMTLAALRGLDADAIVVSPGPCTPNEAGISLEVIEQLGYRPNQAARALVTSKSRVIGVLVATRSANYGVQTILYEIEDQILRIMVVKIGHRRDVYRS